MPYVYTTGNLALSSILTSSKTGFQYYIHRSTDLHYFMHNVGETSDTASSFIWNNSLSFDRTGGLQYSWAFTPQYNTVPVRGTSMLGNRQATSDTYAWTVWVR